MKLFSGNKWIPFLFLFILLGMLGRELFSATSRPTTSSSLVGESLPIFNLPILNSPDKIFTQNELKGKVSLLNVWASWCSACRAEHAMLMTIKNTYHVPIYGILYKDNASNANDLLKKKGNPFVMIGDDFTGDVAIDFGIYGTPETYVISPEGKILYRHIGMMDYGVWKDEIYPIIKKYEKTE